MKFFTPMAAVVIDSSLHVVLRITRDDDTQYLDLHIFPLATLEWRAAEYDSVSTNVLAYVLLLEAYLPQSLYDFNTRQEAKQVLLPLIDNLKAKHVPWDSTVAVTTLTSAGMSSVYIQAAATNPLQVFDALIRAMDTNVIAEKVTVVEANFNRT